jgi:Family of unknown function (DUF5678)
MSDKKLDLLKEQLAPLSPREKMELARFLTEQARLDQPAEQRKADVDQTGAAIKRTQHMAWLKGRREEYAGQYVALDGDRLVGAGATIREAHEQARRQGIERPFLTHISSVYDAPFGGW